MKRSRKAGLSYRNPALHDNDRFRAMLADLRTKTHDLVTIFYDIRMKTADFSTILADFPQDILLTINRSISWIYRKKLDWNRESSSAYRAKSLAIGRFRSVSDKVTIRGYPPGGAS